MPSVQYGTGIYRRDNGNFPELKLINMFFEAAKTSEQGGALMSRPGLGLLATLGGGGAAVTGMFCKAGTLSGDVFTLADAILYRGTTNVGTISRNASSPPSFAAGFGEILIAQNSNLNRYNGTSISSPAFPDNAPVKAVAFIGSLFVALRDDTSGKFYWSDPLDGTTWDALNFATAEREPDRLLDIIALGDNIWLFGQSTIECWAHTGDADLPFTRFEQIAFDQGIMATGCVVAADNTLFFIGTKRGVYRLADVPQKISDPGIDERLTAATSARLFTFWYQGHEFVCIRTNTETLVYDCSTQQWSEFQSSGGNWIVAYAAMQGKTAYLGHATTGQLMGWDEWDDMGATLERRLSFAQQLDVPTSVNVVRVWANAGQTEVSSGTGSDPTISLRVSYDAGNTFEDWVSDRLGVTGEYRCVPEWRCLGMFDFPGIIGEIKVTDPVPFRLSSIKVNDAGGGRDRNV